MMKASPPAPTHTHTHTHTHFFQRRTGQLDWRKLERVDIEAIVKKVCVCVCLCMMYDV